MQLTEEYFARHAIKVPLVRHTEFGSVLFLTPDPKDTASTVKWALGTIMFKPDNLHPGKYSIRLSQPVHNSGERGTNGYQNIENDEIEWDVYEEHILEWSKKKIRIPTAANLRVVIDPKEVELAAWEMFVFNFDTNLVRYASDGTLFKSLDLDLPFAERHRGFLEMIEKLRHEAPNFYELWNRDLKRNTVDKYAYWLANLIGENSAA